MYRIIRAKNYSVHQNTKEVYKPVFDFEDNNKNTINRVSNSNPFRRTEKELVSCYNELSTILGFDPINMNALEHLTVHTTIFAFSKENDDPLGYNEACIVDTTIFTTYCIGNIIFKMAKNKHLATQLLDDYQNNMLKCVLKWSEIDESQVKRVWHSRFAYYNEQCEGIENIIEAFQDILMHDKYKNSIDIYTTNTPISLTEFDEMIMNKSIIISYYFSVLEIFEHSIKDVVETLESGGVY